MENIFCKMRDLLPKLFCLLIVIQVQWSSLQCFAVGAHIYNKAKTLMLKKLFSKVAIGGVLMRRSSETIYQITEETSAMEKKLSKMRSLLVKPFCLLIFIKVQ